MSWKAARMVRERLSRRLRETTNPAEQLAIRKQMDEYAERMDRPMLSPNKLCTQCGWNYDQLGP